METGSAAGDLGAAILVGGGSTRMGRAKQLLTLDGESLIARAFDLACTVAETVTVVGGADEENALSGLSPGRRRAARWLPDAASGIGPAGGVLAALRHDLARDWLVLGCDMPLVDAAAVEWLLEMRRREPAADAWCGRRGGFIEPLPAIYSTRCSAHLQAIGIRGLHTAIESASASTADVPPDLAACWTNINTPDEWEALRRRKGSAHL